MQVIGFTEEGYRRKYIVTVEDHELKTAFEKAYNSDDFSKLKVGDIVNLSDIPMQRARIESACKLMRDAYAEFVKAAPIMAQVASVIGKEARDGDARL